MVRLFYGRSDSVEDGGIGDNYVGNIPGVDAPKNGA
jgi:hypothetical protein